MDEISLFDEVVGLMVEGHWGWHEYCSEHGIWLLNLRPGIHRRSITVFEAANSWRDYTCSTCGRVLWKHGPIDLDQEMEQEKERA